MGQRGVYLSRGKVVLHADDVEVVVADGGHEAAGPGSVAQQRGGVRAVRNHMMPEGEDLDEAQTQQAVLAAHDHVHQGPHHQQQGTHLPMLALVDSLQASDGSVQGVEVCEGQDKAIAPARNVQPGGSKSSHEIIQHSAAAIVKQGQRSCQSSEAAPLFWNAHD